MNRRIAIIVTDEKTSCLPGLIICGTLFLCGCIAGTFCAAFVKDSSSIAAFLSEYLSLDGGGKFIMPSFYSVLVNTFKYQLASFALGFSMLGVIGIPALAGIRGYTLAFSAAVMARLYGGDGALLALSMFGVSTLFTVPCFLIIGAMAFRTSCLLSVMVLSPGTRAGIRPYSLNYFFKCLCCFGLLIIAALLDTYLTVYLVRFAASHIS